MNRPEQRSPGTGTRNARIAVIAGMLVAAITVFAGCKYNTDPQPGRLDPASPYYKVMINEDGLASALAFEEPRVIRDDAGFIRRVEITVRAAAAERLRVDYRPIFKDEAGTVIQPESSWRTKMLEKRVPERIAMLPNSRNATDYEIQFRWAR